jgi:hypothetical protein
VTTQCCDRMQAEVEKRCPDHPHPYDCPNALIVHVSKYREYGLIVHDGGRSYIRIEHCPWCGASLPTSVRDEWFDALEALGLDPWNDDVPKEFEDDTWLQRRSGLDSG